MTMGWLAFGLALSLGVADAAEPQWLRGSVVDDRTGDPVVGAEIALAIRQFSRSDAGSWQLLPLERSVALGRATTDALGRFSVALADLSRFYQLTAHADGYGEQIYPLVKPQVGGAATFYIRMMREATEDGLAGPWAQSWLEDETGSPTEAVSPAPAVMMRVTPPPAAEIVTARLSVPAQVAVTNLGGTGFTGMMDLDEFVASTVTAEMNDGFPFEALKAQAVVSRTYALDRLRLRGYANGGQAYAAAIGAKCLNATLNTSGTALASAGRVITAYFSARCNGDFTLNSEDGPTLSNCRRGGLGAGYVPWARSRPCSGHPNCSATAERCCEVAMDGRTNYIYGHGVGLCQRGAQQFAARDGWAWDQLAVHYFTDIALANPPPFGAGSMVVTSANLNVRGFPCAREVLSTATKGSQGRILAGPERSLCVALAVTNAYLTWWQVRFESGLEGWVVEDYLQHQPGLAPLELEAELRLDPSRLVIRWPADAPAAVLEMAAELSGKPAWETVPGDPVVQENRWEVTLAPAFTHRFFRLRRL